MVDISSKMKHNMVTLSIRSRLAITYTLIFFSVLIFLLAGSLLALYLGLTSELDRELRHERNFVRELIETEFKILQTVGDGTYKSVARHLEEDLDEVAGYKEEFIVVSLTRGGEISVFTNPRMSQILLELPKDIFQSEEGFYNLRINNERYRVNVSHNNWGTLILGLENRTFYEVLDEFITIFFYGVPLTFMLTLVGGWFLAKLTMLPVANVAKAAEMLSLSNLGNERLKYEGRDEFGELVKTLNTMLDRIETSVKQIRKFSQDAAHELRTPLTIIRGELEQLQQQPDLSDDAKSTLIRTHDKVLSMKQMVDNLLLLTQNDAAQIRPQSKPVLLDQLLKNVVEDAQILAENRPIEIKLTKCDPVTVYGDEHLLERLLYNLMDNALKYTEKGFVEFQLTQQNHSACITIQDSGIGIDQKELPHIFDRFYRYHAVRSKTKGSGLGLAICKWIVEQHKGKIEVSSIKAEGTKFQIFLPV
jgi:signal transduction histidine kinase